MTFRELVESYGGREMSGPDDRRPGEVFGRVNGTERYFAWPSYESWKNFLLSVDAHSELICSEFPKGFLINIKVDR
jgi:hypothetical protein